MRIDVLVLAALVSLACGCAGQTTDPAAASGGTTASTGGSTGGAATGGAAVGGNPSAGGSAGANTGGNGPAACPGLPYDPNQTTDAGVCAPSGPSSLDVCDYQIHFPPPDATVYGLIQVLRTPVDGPQEEVPYSPTRGGCSDGYGGWYYDASPSEGTPAKIILCPCTCASLGSGTLGLYSGCHPTIVGVP
jgi:hypothetical protein